MKVRSVTPILNVSDVPASVRWFESLGWSRGFAWNDAGPIENAALENTHGPAGFAGVCANRPEEGEGPMVFLCRDGQGMRDPRPFPATPSDDFGAVWMSWWVDDADRAHEQCVRAGVEVVRPPVTEPWGVREFLVRHPDGHYFRVSAGVGSHA